MSEVLRLLTTLSPRALHCIQSLGCFEDILHVHINVVKLADAVYGAMRLL